MAKKSMEKTDALGWLVNTSSISGSSNEEHPQEVGTQSGERGLVYSNSNGKRQSSTVHTEK